MESATENNRLRVILKVRVKMCGKSAQCMQVTACSGKPYLEQDKIGMLGRPFRIACGYVA